MFDPETADQVKAIIAKGAMGTGVFATGDCRRTYQELRDRGVLFEQYDLPGLRTVDGVAELSVLWRAMTAQDKAQIGTDAGNNVLNGIAYDKATGLFYLTGKRWSVIFAGRFTEHRF